MQLLGLSLADLLELGLQESCTMKLSSRDAAKLEYMLQDHKCYHDQDVRNELELMKRQQLKAEIESVYSANTAASTLMIRDSGQDFLTGIYLIRKLSAVLDRSSPSTLGAVLPRSQSQQFSRSSHSVSMSPSQHVSPMQLSI